MRLRRLVHTRHHVSIFFMAFLAFGGLPFVPSVEAGQGTFYDASLKVTCDGPGKTEFDIGDTIYPSVVHVVSNPPIQIRVEFRESSSGTVWVTKSVTETRTSQNGFFLWTCVPPHTIAGSEMARRPGHWVADFYYDNVFKVGRDFWIKPTFVSTYVPSSVSALSGSMQVYIEYQNGATSHQVQFRFYRPGGAEYLRTALLPQTPCGWCHVNYLFDLTGAQQYPGWWTVRFYIDGNDILEYATRTFDLNVQPGAPTSVTATTGPGPGEVSLTWQPPSQSGEGPVTSYQVFANGVYRGYIGNVLSYRATALSPGEEYCFTIYAVNSGGAGPASSPACASTYDFPSAPLNPTANRGPGSGQITTSWQAPSDNGGLPVQGYEVWRPVSRSSRDDDGTREGELLLDVVGDFATKRLILPESSLTNAWDATLYVHGRAANCASINPLYSFTVNGVAAPDFDPCERFGTNYAWVPFDVPVSSLTAGASNSFQIRKYAGIPTERNLGLGVDQTTDVGRSDDRASPLTGELMMHLVIGGDPDLLVTTVGNTLTWTEAGIPTGESRSYRIRAVTAVGRGALTEVVTSTAPVLPQPPVLVQATTGPGAGELTVAWEPPTDDGGTTPTAYKVYRSTAAAGPFSLLETVSPSTSFIDNGLGPSATRYYKVSTVNGVGEGNQSVTVQATTFAVPSSPQSVAALRGATAGRINLSWSPPADNGGMDITGYKIHRATVAGQETFLRQVGPTTSHADTNLTAGTTYYYKLQAVTPAGEGPLSNEVSATTFPVPGPPVNPTISRGPNAGQLCLAWQPPSSNGGLPILAYRIYRGTTSGQETFHSETGNVLSFCDTGLTAGTTYYYRVAAVTQAGEGGKTATVNAKAPEAPSAPRNLVTTRGPGIGQVTLAWQAPIDAGGIAITGYKVYRGNTSGQLTLLATVGNVLTHTDSGLPNGVQRFYQVRAVNGVGDGVPSSEVPGSTPSFPTEPRNVVAAGGPGAGQIRVTWWAPLDNGGIPLTGYQVYAGPSAASLAPLIVVGPTTLSYTEGGLGNGVTRFYRVAALNTIGEGPQSATTSSTTFVPPSAPGSLTAARGPQAGQISLTWAAGPNGGLAITGYRVHRVDANGTSLPMISLDNVLSYTDAGMLPGESREYRVSAVNDAGEGASTSPITQTAPVAPSATQLLSLVSGPGSGQISLAWQAPASNGGTALTAYRIYRGPTVESTSFLRDQPASSGPTHVDGTLGEGQTACYRVSAVNGVGEGPAAAAVCGKAPWRPGAPGNVDAQPGTLPNQIRVEWEAHSDTGGVPLQGYNVYRSNIAGQACCLVALVGPTTLEYVDSNTVAGKNYFYKVRAVNVVGEGASSNEDCSLATPWNYIEGLVIAEECP